MNDSAGGDRGDGDNDDCAVGDNCIGVIIMFTMIRGTQRQFSENICSEDDLRSRILGTFVVKFLAYLPLLGFSNI